MHVWVKYFINDSKMKLKIWKIIIIHVSFSIICLICIYHRNDTWYIIMQIIWRKKKVAVPNLSTLYRCSLTTMTQEIPYTLASSRDRCKLARAPAHIKTIAARISSLGFVQVSMRERFGKELIVQRSGG